MIFLNIYQYSVDGIHAGSGHEANVIDISRFHSDLLIGYFYFWISGEYTEDDITLYICLLICRFLQTRVLRQQPVDQPCHVQMLNIDACIRLE